MANPTITSNGGGLLLGVNLAGAEFNAEPKPFTLTADPDKIIAAVRRRAPSARFHPPDSRRAVYSNFE
jgi:hypothetical protein